MNDKTEVNLPIPQSRSTAGLERVSDEELTAIYNKANGLDPKRHNPITTERIFAAMRAMVARPPLVLFDGYAVMQALDNKARVRTSGENVSDVLDAVVRLMRSNV